MDYLRSVVKFCAVFVVWFGPVSVSAATLSKAGINATSVVASSNVQEDAVPFGSPFLGGSGFNSNFNPAFGGVSANPALRFRNDFQSTASGLNLPYSQPNCLGHQPGMYGSPTYGCQVFFICQADGRLDPMSCPQGTRFNNYLGVCDWPNKVDANCNPIYSENYERYGALASLYGNEALGGQFAGGQVPFGGGVNSQFFTPNAGGYGGGGFGGFGGGQQFQSQALRFPRPSFRSLRT